MLLCCITSGRRVTATCNVVTQVCIVLEVHTTIPYKIKSTMYSRNVNVIIIVMSGAFRVARSQAVTHLLAALATTV